MHTSREIRRCSTDRRPGAFTIVEILVVMSVIIILLSLVIVAARAATRGAQNANTRTLMNSIKQALIRFEGDIGYLPPILGDPAPPIDVDPLNHGLRKLFSPQGEDLEWRVNSFDDIAPQWPNGTPNPNYLVNVQDWYSVTSLAEYLIGYGGHNHDGYGNTTSNAYPNEVPPVGIRNPDTDGVWGATLYHENFEPGSLRARMNYPTSSASDAMQSNVDIGKVYGPYLELKDERLLAAVDVDADGELVVSFPGDGNFDPLLPRTIVDYWGNPIRYYRRMYSPGSLNAQYYPLPPPTGTAPPHTPTLSDVFVLRPYVVGEGRVIDGLADNASVGDTTTTMALQSAEFALLSPGPDRKINELMRIDYPNDPGNSLGTSFVNEDNIVEMGP